MRTLTSIPPAIWLQLHHNNVGKQFAMAQFLLLSLWLDSIGFLKSLTFNIFVSIGMENGQHAGIAGNEYWQNNK